MFPGFNKKKRSSLGGDFDGDGVRNRKDCQPLNWKKQDELKTYKDGTVKCNLCKRRRFKNKVNKVYVEDLDNWTREGEVYMCNDIDCANEGRLPPGD